ncbi:TetR/AcrR family transcriptional regulator [Kitasatospora sp. NPDC048540]|uniref:TetR/AcrR family transcriptional regulator n=1 Tax=unclassified Kitasatospora TaxID=2633591 RepID=UPI0005395EDD|nr:TetR/AcrR family transcriptional regulator [Kitasatospora sp. MBT63]
MGNREDLLLGAKRCLSEKGYGRTTARDIASAAGVSLAAIGYHYGSKEALLGQAVISALEDWGNAVGAALAGASGLTDPRERFAASWDRVLRTFVEYRGLWTAQFEVMAQAAHTDDLRTAFEAAQKDGRLGLSAIFQGLEEVPDTPDELTRGAFYQALLAGLAAQWLLSPDQAPDGAQLLRGLELVSESVLGQGRPHQA